MAKTLLFVIVILFLTSCNHNPESKPDADRAIIDTVAQTILKPFNQPPPAKAIYAKVEIRQEKFLCQRDEAIRKMISDIKAAPQKFTIDNKLTSEITGAFGTRLSFNAGCFVSNNGNEVKDRVTVELKECYTIEAMLAENLLTSGNENFSSTKGMIYVNAFSNSIPLKLKAGEKVKVQWPFAGTLKEYSLQYGELNTDDQVSWTPVASDNAKVLAFSGFIKPQFEGDGLGFKDYLLENISYPDEAKRNELSAKVDVAFTIDAHGQITDVNSAESYKIFRQAIAESLKKMPAWKPAVYQGKNIASSLHLTIDFNIRRTNQVKIDFNENKAAMVSEDNTLYLLYGSDLKGKAALEKAEPVLTQLGWYNFSKLLRRSNQKPAELIVCANEKSEIRLLMKNQHSILGGENDLGFADFKNLPLGEDAYVIGVKYEGGNLFYAIQPVTLSKQSILTLKWKKGSQQKLLEAYRNLDKLQTRI